MNPRHERRIGRRTQAAGQRPPEYIPRFNRHAKEQQCQMYMPEPVTSKEGMRAFGIRRSVETMAARVIWDELRHMKIARELPAAIQLSAQPMLHLELLPVDVLDRRARHLQREDSDEVQIKKAMETRCRRTKDMPQTADIIDLRFTRGTHLSLVVSCPEITQEGMEIGEVLRRHDIRPKQRTWDSRKPLLAVDLGRTSKALPFAERQDKDFLKTVLSVVDAAYPLNEGLPLEAWHYYPENFGVYAPPVAAPKEIVIPTAVMLELEELQEERLVA
jgi:hypothetical protein